MPTYETGTASSLDDFFTKLDTFCTTAGWTSDELDTATNDRWRLSKGSVFVQARWINNDIAWFQSNTEAGWFGGGGPFTDSGNGDESGSITGERRWDDMNTGPFTAYHFFTDSVTTSTYVHIVLEWSPGIYRHAAFGTLDKVGTWTGGEYMVAHVQAGQTNPNSTSTTFMFDSLQITSSEAGTIHIEGHPDQAGSSIWGLFTAKTVSLGNDKAGNARVACLGGSRDLFFNAAFAGFQVQTSNGMIEFSPVHCYYRNLAQTPNRLQKLGSVKDMRILNMNFINVAEEFTVGGDVWKVFPFAKKGTTGEASGNMAVAYKKI